MMWQEVKKATTISRSVGQQTEWLRANLPSLVAEGSIGINDVFLSGVSSENPSSAFWVGYQSAVQFLFGDKIDHQIAALVVTENKSAIPKHWSSVITPAEPGKLSLVGFKDFVTEPEEIDYLLVGALQRDVCVSEVASLVLKVDVSQAGIEWVEFKPGLPVLPELQKSRVSLNVNLDYEAVLAGDGYDSYIKPFRVIEDFFVSVALLGYLTRLLVASDSVDKQSFIDISALFGAFESVSRELSVMKEQEFKEANFPVEAFLSKAGGVFDTVLKSHKGTDFSEMKRDAMVFKLGEKAREIRMSRAFEKLTEGGVI